MLITLWHDCCIYRTYKYLYNNKQQLNLKLRKMKTINTLLKSQPFTELETKVLIQLNEELKGNFGETYSNVECQDLATALNLEVATIKGVVGSLVKKAVLQTYDGKLNRGDAQIDLIHFTEQEEMDYEFYKK